MTDEMAGLPEDVREALEGIKYSCTMLSCCSQEYELVSAELRRLARENADLHKTFDAKTVHVSIPTAAMYAEFENYARPFKERTERAEAELAALKRRITEAEHQTCATSMPITDGLVTVSWDHFVPIELLGQRVALLPVGGE